MEEIWAQVNEFLHGLIIFEIMWLLHNPSVCISNFIGARLNICIQIKKEVVSGESIGKGSNH